MSKSGQLRLQDSRAIWRLLGECRDLGDERVAWRERLASGLAELVGADILVNGEMGGCRKLAPRDLGVTFWWRSEAIAPPFIAEYLQSFRINPSLSPAMIAYHRCNLDEDGSALRRSDFIRDGEWYRSFDYEMISRPYGVDATMWCFRKIDGAQGDESSGIVALREDGRPDFSPRARTIIRETHRALSPLIGGHLARYADPSPADLPPRQRQVLACMLEGDGDKQIAARLGIARYTVNDYTKAIYRHFGVNGRAQLQARWIRRGWGGQPRWIEDDSAQSIASGRAFSWPA
ncbi:helix-turn-helix transcriptional regulator [Tundrisphaera sp. TA3]|uniref:helix-turn-helix transcriptional regulator n=1 Tax=Tundrisphaera sp. TA3 TaxID=3435775 RepID=UPI003EC08E08